MFKDFRTQNNSQESQNDGSVFNRFITPNSEENFYKKKDYIKIVLMSFLLFAILIAVAMFLYAKVLASQVESSQTKLLEYDTDQSVAQFEQNLPSMRDLSGRLKLLNLIFGSKLYISQMFFPILEASVESSQNSYVFFNKFSLKKNSQSNFATIDIGGVAIDYPTLYRQLNDFRSGIYSANYIKNFKLVGFSLNENGNVDFNISFDIDISTPSFLRFINDLSNINNLNNAKDFGPLYHQENTVAPEIPYFDFGETDNLYSTTTDNSSATGTLNQNSTSSLIDDDSVATNTNQSTY